MAWPPWNSWGPVSPRPVKQRRKEEDHQDTAHRDTAHRDVESPWYCRPLQEKEEPTGQRDTAEEPSRKVETHGRSQNEGVDS